MNEFLPGDKVYIVSDDNREYEGVVGEVVSLSVAKGYKHVKEYLVAFDYEGGHHRRWYKGTELDLWSE